ncbi:bone morphogenetic protein receptor type-2-like isoform X2 [Xiphias gladius]|uniref:bone morphogenetic protein receptor type-2-like isoform X2 n=1 Tax=Xiphias gladius TaxID=8245 RepID=UPI001A995CD0|nr:bone morphogenetic protein receptor type-2-like isoform X2 [Xiphias gladius]
MFMVFARVCLFVSRTTQKYLQQKRQCVFQVTPQNNKYKTAGNVSGSVQVCENTRCCVGYFLIINGRPEADLLACDVAEKFCPDATCRTQMRFKGHLIKCVCNTDLCNRNITWTPNSEQPQLTYSYSVDEIMEAAVIILIGTLLVLCFMIVAAKWRSLSNDKKQNLQACSRDYNVSTLCSCQATKTSEIDTAEIELQRILGRGYFATVWQGKYQGSTVAVKVFPAGCKHRFTAEKEVYELPLMKHAGILHFLGTGRKLDGSNLLIVLQFAEYGSLHSFLCKHTTNWMLSLKLCQSLSQGLSYLHSDLHRYDVHKPPVAHRDLSSSNVLVRADGTCVLCDFGCSTILRACSGHHSWQSHTTNMKGHRQVGTLHYMSPEILEGSVNLSSSWCLMQGDIYALGLLLWEIWMRCSDLFEGSIVPQHLLPYESELEGNVTLESLIMYMFKKDKRPSIPKHWELLPQGPALQELLTDCWDYDPDARLTAQCVVDRLVSLQSCFSP